MIALRRVVAPEAALRPGLVRLLQDIVAGGASVGFLGSVDAVRADKYWRGVLSSLGPGLVLWVAEDAGEVVGTVQLAPVQKDNAPHRADVQKLQVHSAWRGRGIATQLMTTLEGAARDLGRTLLVLDTEAGSGAETLYQRLGWQRVGEIPGFAWNPDGSLRATAYYYKVLRA